MELEGTIQSCKCSPWEMGPMLKEDEDLVVNAEEERSAMLGSRVDVLLIAELGQGEEAVYLQTGDSEPLE